MPYFFDILSWTAMVVLLMTSIPQIVLNFKRKSTEGVSWLTFGLLLFGMSVLFVRSILTTKDIVLQLNYGLGAFIIILANAQFVYYRLLKRHA